MSYRFGWIVLLTVVLAGVLSAQGSTSYEVRDPGQVYYGSTADFSSPAVLDSSRVIDATKEGKEIKRRKLTQRDAEYWILLQKANDRFYAAVSAVAAQNGLDLVAERGAIVVTKEGAPLPDVTSAVIAALDNEN